MTYTARATTSPRRASLDDLAAVILLAGRVRRTPFTEAVGRPLLELPVDPERRLLDLWLEQIGQLADLLRRPIAVRVVVDRNGEEAPEVEARLPVPPDVRLTVEQDPNQYRGTAGLIKDLARDYRPEARLLVASANQLPLDSVAEVALGLAAEGCDVGITAGRDGTVADVMWIRRDTLDSVSDVGFVDLKEQALPQIARDRTVGVVRRAGRPFMPLRTRETYLTALRVLHARRQGAPEAISAYAERWRPLFRVVEPGAQVSERAVLHDSVVLSGGVVEADAVVVRSVVGPGGVCRRGELVADRSVGGESR